MSSLSQKILGSQKIIERARLMFPVEKTVVTWKGAKDSTVLIHIVRSMYKNTIPFPVMFNDTTMEFPEVYEFIRKMTKLWNLNLSVIKHDDKLLKKFYSTQKQSEKLELSRIMKIKALKDFQKKNRIKAYIVGIRRDEHPSRSKEKYFSKRDTHMRVHPILDFTENDIWEYIHRFKVPYVGLYDQGYRSLGEKLFTTKAIPGGAERSGREHNKEVLMEKLRNMGYW